MMRGAEVAEVRPLAVDAAAVLLLVEGASTFPRRALMIVVRGFGSSFKFPKGGVGGGLPAAEGAGGTFAAAAADNDEDLYS